MRRWRSSRAASQFVDAVLSCPEPGTSAYRDALMAFLDCWSEFVPRGALMDSLEEHRTLRAATVHRHAALDGEGSFDPPWHVAVEGGVESSPVAIARAFAECRGTSVAAAQAELRAGAVLALNDVNEAEVIVRRLERAGAKVRVWNGARR